MAQDTLIMNVSTIIFLETLRSTWKLPKSSTREVIGAEPKGTPKGLRLYITVYLDSHHNTDIFNFYIGYVYYWLSRESNAERVDFPYCPRSWGLIFQYYQAYKATRFRIGPVEKSAVAALINTLIWESNTIIFSV